MKEYAVKITETLEKVVYVQAESVTEAVVIAEADWRNGDHILDADNFVGATFEVTERGE